MGKALKSAGIAGLRLLQAALALAVTVAALLSIASTPARAASPTVDAAMAREQRVALVIGNSKYASAPLANPVSDARAMAAALKTMGFRVIALEDATAAQMADAVRRFSETLKPGGVGLFFYAGHGMQVKGRNFLIPVGADIQREDEVAFNSYDAGQVLERMEASKSRINIVILDACRNNPFTRSFRSSTQGLANLDAPFGSYLAMATAPGRVASDGSEGNGLYTRHLLGAMKTPGIPIEEVFKRTRIKVMEATDNQQVPWDYSSLSGDFYFIPSEEVAAAQLAKPSTAAVAGTAGRPQVKLASAAASSQGHAGAADALAPSPSPAAARKEREAHSAESAANASTAYELAMQLKVGRKPLQQDLPRALKLFVEAGSKGHVAAQVEAAQAYARGYGTEKSCKDAIAWAAKAARGGSIEGAVLAADLNRADCAGERNLGESVRWYRVAADKGAAAAQFALGVLYLNGDGVAKDVGEARKWLTAAAGQGNTSAKFYLERLPQ